MITLVAITCGVEADDKDGYVADTPNPLIVGSAASILEQDQKPALGRRRTEQLSRQAGETLRRWTALTRHRPPPWRWSSRCSGRRHHDQSAHVLHVGDRRCRTADAGRCWLIVWVLRQW
jgi:hypothetical protein